MKKTRKILSFILTFSMLFVTIPQSVAVWAASDEAEYAVSLASSAESVEEGETFTVTVSISSSDSEASAAALHGKITYDTSETEYVSAAAPADSGLNVDASADGGTVTLSVYGDSQRVSGDGAVMAELTFRALTPGSAAFSVSDGAVVGKSGASADIPAKSGDSISVTVSAATKTTGDYDLTLGMESDGLTWTLLTVNGETVSREVTGGTTVSNIADSGDIVTFSITAPDNVQYLNVYPHPSGSAEVPKTVEFSESDGIYTLVMPDKNYCVDATTLKLPDAEGYSVTAKLTESRTEGSTYVWIKPQISDIAVTSADGSRLIKMLLSTDGDSWTAYYPSAQDANAYTFANITLLDIYRNNSAFDDIDIKNISLILKAEFASETITSISTEAELLRFAQAVNAGDAYYGVTVTLQNDIALTQPWTESIGNDSDHAFRGTFDGGGHTISGLVIDYTYDVDSRLKNNTRYFGLFGELVSAEIRNLNVEGTIDVDDPVTDWDYIDSGSQYSYIGGIAAHSQNTNFISCTTDVDITASSGVIGGISGGGVTSQYFTDCFNYGDLKVTRRNYSVAGICGEGANSMLRCGNYGNITVDCGPVYTIVGSPASSGSSDVTIRKDDTATGSAAGLASSAKLTECFNKGTVSGRAQYMGGLISSGVSVTDCYNTGMVELPIDHYRRANPASSIAYTGGLVGNIFGNSSFQNCYNSGAVISAAKTYGYSGLLYGGIKGSYTVAEDNVYTSETNPPVSSVTPDLLNGDNRGVWKADENNINGGMPLLYWEDDSSGDKSYSVSFNTGDVSADIRVYRDAEHTQLIESADGAYSLSPGTYYYIAEADGYFTLQSSFTIVRRDVTVGVTLQASADVTFHIAPANASFELSDGSGQSVAPESSSDGDYRFKLYKDAPYKYTVTAEGYNGVTREFTAGTGDTVSVTLTKSDYGGGSSDKYIYGSDNPGKTHTVTSGGSYYIGEGATGTITVDTTEKVTLIGKGVSVKDVYEELSIDCVNAGSNLTIQDVYIHAEESDKARNMINFTGSGNRLYFKGTNILDTNRNAEGYAMVHVNQDTELTLGGVSDSDSLYFYKREMGAGIGGNGATKDSGGQAAETNGKITITGGNLFMKNSKQGALIGAGGASGTLTPGDIIIEGGVLNLVTVSRGSAIGGSAGYAGASSGSNVYVRGGTININIDWSGSAIGGGGYDGGNDSDGGTLYYTSGSIRTFIDQNATSSWNVSSPGIHDNKAITADIVDRSGNELYLLTLDTDKLKTSSGNFTVKDGSSTIYSGGLHEYEYVGAYNTSAGSGLSYTMDNWTSLDDSNLYLYVAGEDHTLTVNGETVDAKWDSASETFTLTYSSGATSGGGGGGTTTETYGDIEITSGAGGTVTIDKKDAKTGETVTITVTPNTDYAVDQVSVTDKDGKAIAVKDNGDGTYTFTKPSGEVKVNVTFKSTVQPVNPDISSFVDVNSSNWFYDAVSYVVEKGLFNGVSETEFAPNTTMTRAMFVTVLGRLEGVDASKYTASSFSDVETGKWYSAYIQWASENNIVNGVGGGKFNPDGEVTREQMAAIKYRYAQFKEIDVTNVDSSAFNAFSDRETVSAYAKDAMIWATANGIINGTGAGLEPKKDATRAQVAQIIKNYAEKIIKA